MMKNMVRRWLAMLMVVMMVVPLIPVIEADAANVSLGIDGLGCDITTTNASSYSTSGATISLTAKGNNESTDSCGNTTKAASGSVTVKFTNSRNVKATLTYTVGNVSLNNGSATTEAGTHSKELNAGETVTITLTSPKSVAESKLTISEISLVADTTPTVTFVPPTEGGSFTVNGAQITENTSFNNKSTFEYKLNASAASGYKFLCWEMSDENGTKYFPNASTTSLFDTETTIKARFTKEENGVYGVGSARFDNLPDAIAYAERPTTDKVIIPLNNVTVLAGEYTIPSGVTLSVPNNTSNTVHRTAIEAYEGYNSINLYRKLTLAEGAVLNVASGGEISVEGSCSYGFGLSNPGGVPNRTYGQIEMSNGSKINLNGGTLYAWGYITGSGEVNAFSGSTVYENLQYNDYRGGRATALAGSTIPCYSYYVQNIETRLNIYSGATEKIGTALYAGGYNTAVSTFVGTGGLFTINSGHLTKWYDAQNDKLRIETAEGSNISVGELSFAVGDFSLSSGSGVLPVSHGMSLTIKSGSEITVKNDIMYLPRSEMIIDEGASVTFNKNVYVVDGDEWNGKNYAWSTNSPLWNWIPLWNSPTRSVRSSPEAILPDALVDINGVINVEGKIFTTSTGGNITSSEKIGVINLKKDEGNLTSNVQVYKAASKTSVTFYPAQLHNGQNTDRYAGTTDEYTQTAGLAAGTVVTYNADEDKWEIPTKPLHDVSYAFVSGTDGMDLPEEVIELTPATKQAEEDKEVTPTQPTAKEVKLSDGTGTWTFKGYDAEKKTMGTEEITFTGTWTFEAATYSLTYAPGYEGGSTSIVSDLKAGSTVTLSADKPARSGYEFTGWKDGDSTDNTVYSAGVDFTMPGRDVTLTAQWAKVYRVVYQTPEGVPTEVVQKYPIPDEKNVTDPEDAKPDKTYEGKSLVIGDQVWLCDGVVTSIDEETATITVTYQWTSNALPHITYDANGGTGEKVEEVYNPDNEFVFPDNPFTRAGYRFAGWKIEFLADGEQGSLPTPADLPEEPAQSDETDSALTESPEPEPEPPVEPTIPDEAPENDGAKISAAEPEENIEAEAQPLPDETPESDNTEADAVEPKGDLAAEEPGDDLASKVPDELSQEDEAEDTVRDEPSENAPEEPTEPETNETDEKSAPLRALRLRKAPAKAGVYQPGEKYDGDIPANVVTIKLTAQWERLYTVQYSFAAKDGSELPDAVKDLLPNLPTETVTEDEAEAPDSPKEGAQVVVADGNGHIRWTFEGYQPLSADEATGVAVFKGVWSQTAVYSVTYSGGAEGVSGEVLDEDFYAEGESVTTQTNAFTRETYEFAGWLLPAETEGETTTVIEAGKTFQMPAHNVELTAKWDKTFTVTYKSEPESLRSYLPEDTTAKLGDTVTAELPTTTSVETENGTYTFVGYDGPATYTELDENVTFTGHWAFTPATAGVTYKFKSGTEGKALPDEVTALLPVDSNVYEVGKTAELLQPTTTSVPVGGDAWVFRGYDADGDTVTVDSKNGIIVVGTWEYVEKASELRFQFHLAGNLADLTQTVDFDIRIGDAPTSDETGTGDYTLTVNGGEPVKFARNEKTTVSLRDGDEVVICGLVPEDYYSFAESDPSVLKGYRKPDDRELNGTFQEYLEAQGVEGSGISATYRLDVAPPTGLQLHVAPYAVMLAAAAVTAVLLKRREGDAED